MKMPLIGALSSVARQKLEDYERAKWDGFSRCSPSVSERRITPQKSGGEPRRLGRPSTVHDNHESEITPPAPLPTFTRAEDLNSLVSLSNSRVSLAG